MALTTKETCVPGPDFLACDLRNQILFRFEYHAGDDFEDLQVFGGLGQWMYEAITGAEDAAGNVQRADEEYLYGTLLGIVNRGNPTEVTMTVNEYGPTMNDKHYPLASESVRVFLDNPGKFDTEITYQYYWLSGFGNAGQPQQATVKLSTLFGAWFWSALLTEGAQDADGYWTFPNRSLTQPELDYIFSGDESLRAGWNLGPIKSKTGTQTYTEFIMYLIMTSPQAFERLPFYNSHLAPGMPFSFDGFDQAALDKVASKIQPAPVSGSARSTDVYEIQGQNLLTWAGASKQPNHKGSDILHTSKAQNWGLQTGNYKARFEEIKKDSAYLPPRRENGSAFLYSRAEWIDLILGPLFGNIWGLSQLEFQQIRGASNMLLPNPVPAYLNAQRGVMKWLTSTNQTTLTMKHMVQSYYFRFIQAILEDSQDAFLNENETTVRQKFDAVINGEPGTGPSDWLWVRSVHLIYENTENFSRVAFWQLAEKVGAGDLAGDAEVAFEEILNTNLASKQVVPPAPPPPTKFKLTQEDIANRQRFFKQCALLLNAQILKTTYRTQLAMDHAANPKKVPFNGRLYMLEVGDGDEDKLINVLTTGGSVGQFFDLTPAEVSGLAPKIQLFRVTNDESSGKLTQTEFVFPRTTSLDRGAAGGWKKKTSFMDDPFDKGDGVGLKEFSFDFNGTNPAEARKDVQATLVLYFQSFADLVRDRKTGAEGETYKYVDLIIHPRFTKSNADKVPVHPNVYDPKFYRIRVDVGYHKGSAPPRLHPALNITNASYYLNMVDHDIKIAPDGSVTLTVNYQAYQETALKSNDFDALATPAMVTRRKKNMQTFREMLLSGKCTDQEIQDFKLATAAQAAATRKHSLSSIMGRLSARDKIYMCRLKPDDASFFRSFGYFAKNKARLVSFDAEQVEVTPKQAIAQGVVNTAFFKHSLTAETYNDPSDSILQYFYFGDLLEVICDSMYQEKDQFQPVEGMENLKFLLGSFDFDPYATNQDTTKILNIGEIPISTNYFSRWFIENIVTQGYTRDAFPILLFIRNLASNLLGRSLVESCINRNVKKNLRFQTSIVVASNEAEQDPLLHLVQTKKGKKAKIVVDVSQTKDLFPLSQQSDISIGNYYNYLLLSTVGSTLTKTGRGDYEKDIGDGRFHIGIGSNRGIVKTISFSKTDMQYVREARFQSNGIDGLMQLSNVYVVTIEMFGNTIFYPGMEVYINPYGIGGTTLGTPTDSDSIANKLGLGGYHTITSVKTSLTPGSFKTTIQAQWYFSGNPDEAQADKDGTIPGSRFLKDPKIADPVPNRDENYCLGVLKGAETDLTNLNMDPSYESITSATAPAAATTDADAIPVNTEPPESNPNELSVTFTDVTSGRSTVVTYDENDFNTDAAIDNASGVASETGHLTVMRYKLQGAVVATYIANDNTGECEVRFPDGTTFIISLSADDALPPPPATSEQEENDNPEFDSEEEPPESDPGESDPDALDSDQPESSPEPIPEETIEAEQQDVPEKSLKSKDGWTYEQVNARETAIAALPEAEKDPYKANNPAPYIRIFPNRVMGSITLFYDDNSSEVIWSTA